MHCFSHANTKFRVQIESTSCTGLVQAQCKTLEATCKEVQGERDAARAEASSLEQRLGDTTAKLDAAQAEVAKLQAEAKTKQVWLACSSPDADLLPLQRVVFVSLCCTEDLQPMLHYLNVYI